MFYIVIQVFINYVYLVFVTKKNYISSIDVLVCLKKIKRKKKTKQT